MKRCEDIAKRQAPLYTSRVISATHEAPLASSRSLSRRAARGIVLVITLLAVVLLAALVFFVMNMGRHVDSRVVTQNAADSAANAGAGWIARTFNLVAMNNVTQARYLATVNVLDSMPLVTQNALHEQSVLRDSINQATGINTGNQTLNSVINEQLDYIRVELQEEVDLLTPVNDLFNTFDVTTVTHYGSAANPGRLWAAMSAMAELSPASLEIMPYLAQRNAVDVGRANLEADDASRQTVFMAPLTTTIPYRVGQFNEFERAVKHGLLPSGTDHSVVNRGPWDTVYGWRTMLDTIPNPNITPGTGGGSTTSGVNTGGVSSPYGGGPGNQSGGGAPSPGPPASFPIAYAPYGTQRATIGIISSFCGRSRHRWYAQQSGERRPNLEESRFATWTRAVANDKMRHLWPDVNVTTNDRFAFPTWSDTYPVNTPPPGAEMAFWRLDIKSRYPVNHGSFMSSGDSWWFEGHNRATFSDRDPQDSLFRLIRQGHWWTTYNHPQLGTQSPRYPHMMQSPGITVTGIDGGQRRSWMLTYQYTVDFDHDIGITVQYDADGNIIPQPAYFIQILVYGGVNSSPMRPGTFNAAEYLAAQLALLPQTATPEEIAQRTLEVQQYIATHSTPISNPYANFNPTSLDAPRPTDIDQSVFNRSASLDPEANAIRNQMRDYTYANLTFLGVARRDGDARLWHTQFESRRPQHDVYALAQVRVFNNHSFDLWTPMWQAHLEPIISYDDWVTLLGNQSASGSNLSFVSDQDLQSVVTFLTASAELADVGLAH